MILKNFRKSVFVFIGMGLLLGVGQGAYAADQKQIDADMAAGARFQQSYQANRQALEQAYRAGNRQGIINYEAAVNDDIRHIQANAQDLARNGVSNPYPVPAFPSFTTVSTTTYDQSYRQRDNGRSRRLRFRDMDQNNDSNVSRGEWKNYSDQFFDIYDLDNNGSLSRGEVNEMKTSTYWGQGDNDNTPNPNDLFRVMDLNNNNLIARGEWTGSYWEFNRLDMNNDGNLSTAEFRQPTSSDNFRSLDRNNDGFVARGEWRYTAQSFTALDYNNDGQLSRDEFYNRTQAPVAVFSEMDTNRDGRVSRNEWRGDTATFNNLDINRDNVLVETELSAQANTSSGSSQQQMIEQIFQQFFKS